MLTNEVTEQGGGVKGRKSSVGGKSLINNSKTNEVWVATEPTGDEVQWKGGNKFHVECCIDAFSKESDCKFAFCPVCSVTVRDVIVGEDGGSSITKDKANKRPRREKKSDTDNSAVQTTGGLTNKKKGGGECGKHTLRDILNVDHTIDDSAYLKRRNATRVGAERIATHCVYCGIKF